MKRPKENKKREDRITEEVVVDAYNEEERAMGWYYYAADNIAFPFKAQCVLKRSTSPLKVGDQVKVIGIAPEERLHAGTYSSDHMAGFQFRCSSHLVEGLRTDDRNAPGFIGLEILGGPWLSVLSDGKKFKCAEMCWH